MRVHVERLLAGDRVCADEGVLGGNGVTAGDTAAVQAGVDLFDAGVDGAQAVQSLPEVGRETLVGLHHVAEQGVTACRGAVEYVQEGRAGGLLLEGDVRVPGDGVGALLQERRADVVVCAAEDEVDLRESLWRARGLVDVVSAEVAGVVDGFLDGQGGEVLVSEGWFVMVSLPAL